MISKPCTIWIFQTGEPLHIDGCNARPMRAMNLSNAVIKAGHKVVLWSAAFNHQEKRKRTTENRIKISDHLEVRLISSCGYNKNIGLKRLVDHAQLALSLKTALNKCNEIPDVAFIGFPPIETAYILANWLKKRGVPSLLDVKDQWPAIFLDAMPAFVKPLGRIVLMPYYHLARQTMKNATGITAMADGFLNWALTFAGRERTESDGVFPLTSQLDQISDAELDEARHWWGNQWVQNERTFRICYVGNHSKNVDLVPVKTAASLFIEKKIAVEFIIAGNGVSLPEFKELMSGLPNVLFPGFIDRPKFVALAERACASLIPYVNSTGFQLSLPNKTFDSLALGLPILTPLQGEVAQLISKHNVGLSYGTDTGKSLYDCIMTLIQHKGLQHTMSNNARRLYEEKFSFEMVYGGFVKHLERISTLRLRPS